MNAPVPFRKWVDIPSPTISALTLAPEFCHVTFLPLVPAAGVVSLKLVVGRNEPPFTVIVDAVELITPEAQLVPVPHLRTPNTLEDP